MKVNHEFGPWYNEKSKILILGSMPSIKSREEGYYYAHPKNRFWQVLSEVFKEEIIDKKEFCSKHYIALWDTIESCEIHASSDASIKNIIPNDINLILKNANIKQIFTAGKKAHEIYQKYIYPKTKQEDICLPSTSPANAKLKLEDLVKEYLVILEYLK